MKQEEVEKVMRTLIRCEDEYTGAIYAEDSYFIAFSFTNFGVIYDLFKKDNYKRSYTTFEEIVEAIKRKI